MIICPTGDDGAGAGDQTSPLTDERTPDASTRRRTPSPAAARAGPCARRPLASFTTDHGTSLGPHQAAPSGHQQRSHRALTCSHRALTHSRALANSAHRLHAQHTERPIPRSHRCSRAEHRSWTHSGRSSRLSDTTRSSD